MKNKHIGSSFEDFLKEEGIHEATTSLAIKRVIAWQVAEAMKARKISKVEMARRLKTSRTQVARFLDPENVSVQLDTIRQASDKDRLCRLRYPRLDCGRMLHGDRVGGYGFSAHPRLIATQLLSPRNRPKQTRARGLPHPCMQLRRFRSGRPSYRQSRSLRLLTP
jgi:antitoxin HicB